MWHESSSGQVNVERHAAAANHTISRALASRSSLSSKMIQWSEIVRRDVDVSYKIYIACVDMGGGMVLICKQSFSNSYLSPEKPVSDSSFFFFFLVLTSFWFLH